MNVIDMKAQHCDDFCKLRWHLFKALNETETASDTMDLERVTRDYYLSHIGNDLFCWGIQVENEMVAIAAMCIFSRIPYAGNLSGKEGYVLNVYTEPAFRKKGLSKSLVDALICYASNNGVGRLWLNNSDQGKSIYKACGFVEKDHEMELYLNR